MPPAARFGSSSRCPRRRMARRAPHRRSRRLLLPSDPLGREYLTDLLQRAVRVNSVNPPGREAEVAELFRAEMASWGLETRLDEVAPGRANAIGRLPGKGTGPALL